MRTKRDDVVPFAERLGCSVPQSSLVLNQGRTKTYEDLAAGRLQFTKSGKRTIISVRSVIARARDLGLLEAKGKRPVLEEPKALQGAAKAKRLAPSKRAERNPRSRSTPIATTASSSGRKRCGTMMRISSSPSGRLICRR
jgi:hypothetical protein